MKVAVAYDNGEIYGHFGHCDTFAVYEYGEYVSDCVKKLVDSSDRHGHAAMAALMQELGVDAVLCGNMGGEGKALLLSLGIVPVVGYSGDADTAADLLVTGQLPITPGAGGGCSCGGNCS
ncbi:MAG: NifB/NifX family molybdenum-iron cluster-binding protein, partial [Oscillospiraceae bacterium]|nr:NifB/NifX family molybdenum-iron cluster-binding protein [Oscillospiraceae bacterium]